MFDTILDAYFFLAIAASFLFVAIVVFIYFLKDLLTKLFNKIVEIIINDSNEFYNED